MKRAGYAPLFAIALGAPAAHAVCLAQRPTAPGAVYGYGGAPAGSLVGAAVRVWFAESGPHVPPSGAAATVVAVGDEALAAFAGLGFAPPLGDELDVGCADNGGDGRVDIYLYDFSSSADGTIALESCTTSAGGSSCRGFAIVENDFAAGSYPSHEDATRTVVTHELFHLVQAALDAEIEAWWSEGTAQWAMETVHPDLDDFERFLPAFLGDPTRPLDSPASGATSAFLYGSAIFPQFLRERHDVALVVTALERGASLPGPSTDALDAALAGRGSSLEDAYAEFTWWNAATGSRAGSHGYAQAATYPEVPLEALDASGVSDLTSSLSAHYYRLPASAAPRRVAIETDPSRNHAAAIPLRNGVAVLAEARELPLDAADELVIVVAGITTNKERRALHAPR